MATKAEFERYADLNIVPLVDPLIKALLLEKPADPAAFCAQFFHGKLQAEASPPEAADESASQVQEEPQAEASAVKALEARIAELEAENARLTSSQAVDKWQRAAHAVKSNGATELFVVNWNLAGVNSNAFEFHLSDDPAYVEAIAFVRALDDTIRHAVKDVGTLDNDDAAEMAAPDGSFLALLADMTVSELLAGVEHCELGVVAQEDDEGLQVLHRQYSVQASMVKMLETRGGDSVLRQLRLGLATSEFSKPDALLKDRTFAWTNLPPAQFEAFLQNCAPGSESGEVPALPYVQIRLHLPLCNGWWSSWIKSMADCSKVMSEGPEAFADVLLRMAVFDGFLRLAICYTLAAVEVTSPELVGNLAAKLGDFVVAMNTAPDAKAAAVAQALKWLLDAFAPDIIALEEYNSECGFWTEQMLRDYQMFEPTEPYNPFQMTVLLMRKSEANGKAIVESSATETLTTILADPDLLTSLEALYVRHRLQLTVLLLRCAHQLNYDWLQLDATPEFLRRKIALAAFRTETGNCGLAVAAHAASDGTDNRAIVICSNEIRRRLGSETTLVLALDANSALSFPKKGILAGAANMALFNDHIQAAAEPSMTSCWESRLGSSAASDDKIVLPRTTSVYNSKMPHSVLKERSFLQAQWKKADHLDLSMKDWVITTEGAVVYAMLCSSACLYDAVRVAFSLRRRSEGITINRTSASLAALHGRAEFSQLGSKGADDAVWDSDANMPSPPISIGPRHHCCSASF